MSDNVHIHRSRPQRSRRGYGTRSGCRNASYGAGTKPHIALTAVRLLPVSAASYVTGHTWSRHPAHDTRYYHERIYGASPARPESYLQSRVSYLCSGLLFSARQRALYLKSGGTVLQSGRTIYLFPTPLEIDTRGGGESTISLEEYKFFQKG